VIEDNRTDVFLIKESIAFHHLDAHLQIMEDGEQAIAFIDSLDAENGTVCPDLMLLDLNLPRASGIEVLARLRESKRCGSIPVVVMTSSNREKDRADTAALGATAYFLKPSGYEAFLKIGELIQNLL
jgi:chemotaxis family two-component system response regulator Rcp1